MTPESVGRPIRPYLLESHRLVCDECRHDWHPIKPTDPEDRAWYGRCVNCNSANLIIESEPIAGAPCTDEWHLKCDACDATWVGLPDDPCWWCQRAAEIQIEHQIDLLLKVPDVNPDDVRYSGIVEAWAQRLAIGVKAGLITQQQAINAGRSADRQGAA